MERQLEQVEEVVAEAELSFCSIARLAELWLLMSVEAQAALVTRLHQAMVRLVPQGTRSSMHCEGIGTCNLRPWCDKSSRGGEGGRTQ